MLRVKHMRKLHRLVGVGTHVYVSPRQPLNALLDPIVESDSQAMPAGDMIQACSGWPLMKIAH